MTIHYGAPALILIGIIAALVILAAAVLIASDIREARRERANRDQEAE